MWTRSGGFSACIKHSHPSYSFRATIGTSLYRNRARKLTKFCTFASESPPPRSTISAFCNHLPIDFPMCESSSVEVCECRRMSFRSPYQHGTRVHCFKGLGNVAVAVRGAGANSLQRVLFAQAKFRPQRRCGCASCAGYEFDDTALLTSRRWVSPVPIRGGHVRNNDSSQNSMSSSRQTGAARSVFA